ncbi:hypothetical protein A4H97_08670 [Niastella yeongjuensis]|uniref:Uncharacterized protein n=1 Tax=Niastella yeongjuensis TaxID=354355 RepID=A0A1V9EEF0_9BACT|nr:hypothetical protein [Niastella yeongjuensis]OQP44442.1 hypothetical protein A4H97_08670 [Niastella yeongjuensis]SEO87548.1 hypothetical protein SAMN05660816_03812 [Niastella yeongjuensis]
MRLLFCFLLLWLCIGEPCWAQDLSGTWEGRIDAEYMNLVLIKQGSTYIGYTYDEGMGFCKTNFLGNFNDSTRLLKGAGQSFIARTANHVMCTYKLTFSVQSDGKYLIGSANAKSALTQILSMGMAVRTVLRQVSSRADTTDYMFSWLVKHNSQNNTVEQNRKADTFNTAIAVPAPSLTHDELAKKAFNDSITAVKILRVPDTLSTIITAADSIVISIADNEVVDGDTVTVFHNNAILVSRLFVSAHPYRVVVPLDRNVPVHEFVLVANNLGTIPPNTALLTIEAGKDRFQLKAASDLKKNAVIIFKHK